MAALNQARGTAETPRTMGWWRRFARAEALRFRVPPASRIRWMPIRWALNAVWPLHVWLELEKRDSP